MSGYPQTQPVAAWRTCRVCKKDRVTLLELDAFAPITCQCKHCGHTWNLTCPRCAATVERTVTTPFASGTGAHLTALCSCGYRGGGSWNVKRQKRSQAVVAIAKASLPSQCAECGCTVAAGGFELDHKQALCRGGLDVVANLQVLCLRCHDAKTYQDCGWQRSR